MHRVLSFFAVAVWVFYAQTCQAALTMKEFDEIPFIEKIFNRSTVLQCTGLGLSQIYCNRSVVDGRVFEAAKQKLNNVGKEEHPSIQTQSGTAFAWEIINRRAALLCGLDISASAEEIKARLTELFRSGNDTLATDVNRALLFEMALEISRQTGESVRIDHYDKLREKFNQLDTGQ